METESASERVLFTTREVAEMLSIGRTTLYQLMQKGQIRGLLIGRSRRFTREEVDAFVQNLQGEAAVEVGRDLR